MSKIIYIVHFFSSERSFAYFFRSKLATWFFGFYWYFIGFAPFLFWILVLRSKSVLTKSVLSSTKRHVFSLFEFIGISLSHSRNNRFIFCSIKIYKLQSFLKWRQHLNYGKSHKVFKDGVNATIMIWNSFQHAMIHSKLTFTFQTSNTLFQILATCTTSI